MAAATETANSSPRLTRLALGGGAETVLPQDDKSFIPDKEYAEQRAKIVQRSKLLFWWSSVSRVGNMIAAMLIPAGIALLVAGLTNKEGLAANLNPVLAIFGTAVASLAVGLTTDYFENLVRQNLNRDSDELTNKRLATHQALAMSTVKKMDEAEKAATPTKPVVAWVDRPEVKPAQAAGRGVG